MPRRRPVRPGTFPRLPRLDTPNAFTVGLAEAVSRGETIDLTEANPTRVGLSPPVPALTTSRLYMPDPLGWAGARRAIAGYYEDAGLAVDESAIALTSGTSEAYAHLFNLLAAPGEKVLAPRPSYPLFGPLAAVAGVSLGSYPLAYDGRWHLDRDAFGRALEDDVRAVVLVQPNHPTGTCLAADDLEFVDALCAAHGAAVISDEVFADFPWSKASPFSSVLASPREAMTFALSGLSKVCGLPQLKLSWIVAAGPTDARDEAMRGLAWIGDLFLSVSAPVQTALPRLLTARRVFQDGCLARVHQNLVRLRAAPDCAPSLTHLPGDGGWVALLRLPRTRSDEAWALSLLKHGVVTHPGYFYDVDEEACLVVSLIVEPDVFDEGCTRIATLVREAG